MVEGAPLDALAADDLADGLVVVDQFQRGRKQYSQTLMGSTGYSRKHSLHLMALTKALGGPFRCQRHKAPRRGRATRHRSKMLDISVNVG